MARLALLPGLLALLLGSAPSPAVAQPAPATDAGARWDVASGDRLLVWVEPASGVLGWSPGYVAAVHAAFREWTRAGPVGFRFVADSARSDVRVHWVGWFDEPGEAMSGRTTSVHNAAGRIVQAGIELAVHHHDGRRLSDAEVRAMALHEIGHALGLEHARGRGMVMSPTVRVLRLSAADVAAARQLYARSGGRAREANR